MQERPHGQENNAARFYGTASKGQMGTRMSVNIKVEGRKCKNLDSHPPTATSMLGVTP